MNTIALQTLELSEVWSKADPNDRARFTFPISAATGAERSSVAYVELPPGGAIPTHFDSANEILVILDGVVEVDVAGQSEPVGPGSLVEIPAASSHRIANSGAAPAHLLHVFDDAADVVTFDHPLMPLDRAVLGG
jgi:quercetin dioxygenase-like cupin family protein